MAGSKTIFGKSSSPAIRFGHQVSSLRVNNLPLRREHGMGAGRGKKPVVRCRDMKRVDVM